MKWSAAAVFCVLIFLRLNAVGQMETDGTIIIFNASEKEIVIAADSRGSGTHSYTDDKCKISAFGDKLVFAASGRTGLRNEPTNYWDAYAIAREDFKRLTRKGTSDDLPIDLAKAWEISIKQKIEDRQDNGVDVVAGLDSNAIMFALFAGVRKDGSILTVVEQITYEVGKDGKARIVYRSPHILDAKDFPNWMGRYEIIEELKAGQTFRSDQWRRKINAVVSASPDPVAALAIEQVKLTIDNLGPTKKNYAGVPFSEVGYPISAVRLTSKGAEWIEKGNCPQE
jgi:hypothetical protein